MITPVKKNKQKHYLSTLMLFIHLEIYALSRLLCFAQFTVQLILPNRERHTKAMQVGKQN